MEVAENRFKMPFMMNKFAMINSCEIILEKFFFAKNHCEIQVHIILNKIRYTGPHLIHLPVQSMFQVDGLDVQQQLTVL